jgi:hypothetical protein
MQTLYEMPLKGGTIDIITSENSVVIRWDEHGKWHNAKFLKLPQKTAALLAQEIIIKLKQEG